jgi:non-homologous end joining protein Ku
LTIQKHEIAVKLFSAVVDSQVHFHLLHKPDRTRVQQLIVDEHTGIGARFARAIRHDELVDKDADALLAIVEKKRKSGRSLIRVDQDADKIDSDQDGDVDLLETIRRSLRRSTNGSAGRHRKANAPHHSRVK